MAANHRLKGVLDEGNETLIDEVVDEGSGGHNAEEKVDSREGESKRSKPDGTDEIQEFLEGLNSDDKAVVKHFSPTEWLTVVHSLRKNPEFSVIQVVQQVGAHLLERIQEASATQYATQVISDTSELKARSEALSTSISLNDLAELARWSPLRLSYGERELMKLLESTLYISDYTDSIDIFHAGDRKKQILTQIRQICSILTGLVVARDYEEGQRLIKDRSFAQLAPFFQACFEIGRRYKVLNPERMRDSYGKLMYFLMDARRSQIIQLLEFDCVGPVKTVHDLLSRKHGLDILKDKLLLTAIQEIYTDGLAPMQVSFLKENKEKATRELIAKYSTVKQQHQNKWSRTGGFLSQFAFPMWSSSTDSDTANGRLSVPQEKEWNDDELTEADVELAIYSLKDHMTFLRYNERPVDIMLKYLTELFDPHNPEEGFSLSIQAGRHGARLSHGHERQFQYVKQSLLLWRAILRNFLKLWTRVDYDLLREDNPYQLRDTGQGLNRIQPAPNVFKMVNEIIYSVQRECGSWMGSSVVHMGDHNVPNGLMFIDKYSQVPRIIGPIVRVLDEIENKYRSDRGIALMIDNDYGSPDALKKYIVCDFFKHAFDGSGADNFFDAGSCIDGRLTSAWNWCSTVDKKKYYPIFLLCGFIGFDGKF